MSEAIETIMLALYTKGLVLGWLLMLCGLLGRDRAEGGACRCPTCGAKVGQKSSPPRIPMMQKSTP